MATEAKTARALCPVCDDTGWKTIEGGRVTRCDCRVRARGASLEDAARIPRRYAKCSLKNFDVISEEHKSLADALFLCDCFVREYLPASKGLLFIGPTHGVGKTHLAVAVVRELMETKGVSCLFVDYRDLLREIRRSYDPQVQGTEIDVLRPIINTEVVLIDDLGASAMQTAWERDTVAYILNRRYSDEKTTIVTTALLDQPCPQPEQGPELLETSVSRVKQRNRVEAESATRDRTLGERIGDQMRARLHEMCRKVELTGKDFRELCKQVI